MSADAAATAAARRLHPATLISRSLQMVPRTVAAGAGYAAVIAQEGLGRILLFGGLAALLGVGAALLVWWRFLYTVGEREIVIESGVLHRQRRVIPFDRVQDIAIERPLLARLFGTARVRVETGGSAADEGNLDMIAIDDAHRLRDLVRRWNAAAPTAVAEGAAAEAEPVLFEIGMGRLLYSGLFNFSLLFLAAIFAVVQYLDDFGLVEPREWITPEKTDAATGLVTLRATLVLIAILLALGLIAGVARTIAKDFGYRLTRSEAGFRRRRGLFTLSEVVIPVRRTQVAVIDSGPVARALGWYRLSFQTLGADQKEGGVQVAAPFARMEEILPILAEAGFPPPPPRPSFARPPRRALLRWAAAPYLAPALAAAAAALVWDVRAGIAAAALLALAAFAALRWRRHLHAIDEEALFVSNGLLGRRLSIIPVARTQTVSLFRSPLQRRLRLATLLVDTAGAPLLRSPEVVDLEAEEAEALAGQLLRRFLDARERSRADSTLRLQPRREGAGMAP